MAVRNPANFVTSYQETECDPRKPIVTTHYDAALDNQERVLRNPRIIVSECIFPNSTSNDGAGGFYQVFKTKVFSRHKCGTTFGNDKLGKAYAYMYEADSSLLLPTVGTYQIRISDGVTSDTTTVSTYSSTGRWVPLTISATKWRVRDMSAMQEVKVEVGNFSGGGSTAVYYAYFCGLFILDND